MTVDPAVVPGLLLLALELLALAAVGYVVARVALRQTDDLLALAQGMVIGLALWGLIVNFAMHLLPGLAGALAGWIVILTLGTGLAWRARQDLHVPARTLAGFGLAGAAIFWVALASRQLLSIPDEDIHLAIASTIRVGQFPPVLSWIPDQPLPYHYGADLLIALLTPPVGPDLAFTTEVLGAYVWTGFVVSVATALMRRAGASALIVAPLMVTAGAWSLIWYADAPHILKVAVPAGIPEAGIRASLGDIYWPSVSLPWTWPGEASPPNIWKPPFVLSYALGFIVLERVAAAGTSTGGSTWPLALLIGFVGLMAEEVALVVLALWVALESVRFVRARPSHVATRQAALRASAGPLLATLPAGPRGWSPYQHVDRRGRKRAFTGLARQCREPSPPGRPRSNARRGWHPRPRRAACRSGSHAPRPPQSPRRGASGWQRRISHCRVSAAIRPRGRSYPHGRPRPQLRPAGAAGGAGHSPERPTASLAPCRHRRHSGARHMADDCEPNTQHGLGPQPRTADLKCSAERA